MTQAELIVIENLPGPESKGVTDAVATNRCWRDGLLESRSWPVRKDLMERGYIEAVERLDKDQKSRLFYRLTEKGVAEKGKVAA